MRRPKVRGQTLPACRVITRLLDAEQFQAVTAVGDCLHEMRIGCQRAFEVSQATQQVVVLASGGGRRELRRRQIVPTCGISLRLGHRAKLFDGELWPARHEVANPGRLERDVGLLMLRKPEKYSHFTRWRL